MIEFTTMSSEDTMAFGERLASLLQPGAVLTLEGDLGAGKTTFTKGLARGLGITRTVNSPTFTIIKEYRGKLPLYHMDVYRLGDDEELGFEEYFQSDGVTVVEWASQIESQLPTNRLDIEIEHAGEDERIIRLSPNGESYESICEELTK